MAEGKIDPSASGVAGRSGGVGGWAGFPSMALDDKQPREDKPLGGTRALPEATRENEQHHIAGRSRTSVNVRSDVHASCLPRD